MTNEQDKRKAPLPTTVPISTSRLPGERRFTQAPPPPPTLSGGGSVHPPSTDFAYWARQAGKPDWSYWSNMEIVDFDDACYLSYDIDPEGARRLRGTSGKFSKVEKRSQIARNHLGKSLPAYMTESDRYYEGGGRTGVNLSEFRAWGESLPTPFTFPDEFPNAAMPEPVTPTASAAPAATQWPWGDHETKLLRHLAAAAEKFWKLYDPTDSTTAPKNNDVVAWLKGKGVSGRNAEAMATMLRADNLPTGPRK